MNNTQTCYVLSPIDADRTGRTTLYSNGMSRNSICACGIEEARRLTQKHWPAWQEISRDEWDREWYRRNEPTFYTTHFLNGGWFAYVWPFARARWYTYGLTIKSDPWREFGSFRDKEALIQAIAQDYRGALFSEAGQEAFEKALRGEGGEA